MKTTSCARTLRAAVGAGLRRFGLHEPARRLWTLVRTWPYRHVDRVRVALRGQTVEFRTDDDYSRSWFFPRYAGGRIHEPAVTEKLVEAVQETRCFVDVGAHLGWYTCIAARHMSSGRVLSFEMDELSFALLRRNVAANGCANVEAFNLAVSDAAGAAGFRRAAERPSPGYRLEIESGGDEAGYVGVETVALDEFLEARGIVPDVVKIDVEGAELKVLRGLRRTLDRWRPVLFLEVHPVGMRRLGGSVSAILSLLAASGYSLFEIGEAGGEGSGRALRPVRPDSILQRNLVLYGVPGS